MVVFGLEIFRYTLSNQIVTAILSSFEGLGAFGVFFGEVKQTNASKTVTKPGKEYSADGTSGITWAKDDVSGLNTYDKSDHILEFTGKNQWSNLKKSNKIKLKTKNTSSEQKMAIFGKQRHIRC